MDLWLLIAAVIGAALILIPTLLAEFWSIVKYALFTLPPNEAQFRIVPGLFEC
jgi:hypothetical protein